MLIKILLVVLLLIIVVSLFQSLLAMLKSEPSKPMSYYLGRRVALCVVALVVILLAHHFGALQFNASPITVHTQK